MQNAEPEQSSLQTRFFHNLPPFPIEVIGKTDTANEIITSQEFEELDRLIKVAHLTSLYAQNFNLILEQKNLDTPLIYGTPRLTQNDQREPLSIWGLDAMIQLLEDEDKLRSEETNPSILAQYADNAEEIQQGSVKKPDKEIALAEIDDFYRTVSTSDNLFIKEVFTQPSDNNYRTETPIVIESMEQLRDMLIQTKLTIHNTVKNGLHNLKLTVDSFNETLLPAENKEDEINNNELLKEASSDKLESLKIAPFLLYEGLKEPVKRYRVEEVRDSINDFLRELAGRQEYQHHGKVFFNVQGISDFRTPIQNKQIDCHMSLLEHFLTVVVDNMIDAKSNYLKVSFSQGKNVIFITFEDQGPGFPKELIQEGKFTGQSLGENKVLGGTGQGGDLMQTIMETMLHVTTKLSNVERPSHRRGQQKIVQGARIILEFPLASDSGKLSAVDAENVQDFKNSEEFPSPEEFDYSQFLKPLDE